MAEAKYTTLRSHHSSSFRMDDVLDLMIRTHLEKEYGNKKETLALLKITGMLNAIEKRIKWTATREDYIKFMGLAERERIDRKFGLTKAEGAAKFALGRSPRPIPQVRPADYNAKKGTPYTPRKGSSKGKLGTIQRGAVKTEKALQQFFEALFSLQPDGKNKTKQAKFAVKRTLKL